MQRDDLPEVADLVGDNLPGWAPEGEIPEFLASTLIDDPWSDEELPSLVGIGNGDDLTGFVASQVRRFQLGERRLRGICVSHVVVAEDQRAGPTGALLMRRLFKGSQDFTYSDSASVEMVRMWRALGGHMDYPRACDWMIVLRPIRWLSAVSATALHRRRTVGRGEVPVGALPFQAAGPRFVRRAFPPLPPGVTGEDAGTETIVELLPELTKGVKLRADYDVEFLGHLSGLVESLFGELIRRVVRRDGRPVGWYAMAPSSGGVTRVLHVAFRGSDGDAVVGELVQHARESGRTVITGRLEPHLLVPLRHRFAVLGFARQPVIHAPDPEIRATLGTSGALLTQLDSEWFVL